MLDIFWGYNIGSKWRRISMKTLFASDLREGMVTGADTYTDQGYLVVPKNTILTKNLITRIINNNVLTVEITGEEIVSKKPEESENKLLKSMEEFPTYVKLIFTSSNTHGVLRTILSRVEVVRIPRFTFEEFKDILSGEENASGLSIDSIYSISSGNLFYGLKLLQDSTVREVYENCLEILLKIDKKNIAGYSIQINKNNLEEYIRMFTIILSKMITSKTLNSGEYDLINSHYTIKALADISNELEYSNKKIIANVNEQGIIDNLLIKIMEAKI